MRHFYLLAICLLCGGFSSCIKDEPLNAECDIEQAFIHADDPAVTFYIPRDSIVNVLSAETTIRFGLRDADLTALAPQFRLTEGATIEPASGSVQDFSNGPVVYTVTSQDRQWSKKYMVYADLRRRTIDEMETLSFDGDYDIVDRDKIYKGWKEILSDGYVLEAWATGNSGFAITAGSKPAEDYPSTVLEEGYIGKGVKLTTRSTGVLGSLVKMPIAAGNLFTGRFDAMSALTGATKATLFGVPVARKPVMFSGYYKYTPGERMTGADNKVIPGKTDEGDIYAILYYNVDKNGNEIILNGDDIKTSPYIVATAEIGHVVPAAEWTPFNIVFNYKKEIDRDVMRHYGYNLAIVFSSSVRGAYFEGAVGSTLLVDEVKLTYENLE